MGVIQCILLLILIIINTFYVMRLKKDDLTFVLDWIKRYGDSNLFPRPFELDFIDINEVKVDLNKWNPVWDLRYLVPKNNSSFRTASLLDPTDILLYNTFLFSLIKNNVEIYNKNYVYSDIFKVDDEKAQYINQNYKWFMEETLSLGGWCWFILSTDIADFSREYICMILKEHFILCFELMSKI